MKPKKKHILLTGYGFIAKSLIQSIDENEYHIIHISSKKQNPVLNLTSNCTSYSWEQIFTLTQKSLNSPLSIQLQSIVGIINFAGFPIAKKRWKKKIAQKIFFSRIRTTYKLIQFIKQNQITPSFFLQASAVGYYGNKNPTKEKNIFCTEESISNKNTFLSRLCHLWEKHAIKIQLVIPNSRFLILRFGMVLSPSSLTWKRMYTPISKYLGFYLGDGKQNYSWITLYDAVHAIKYLIENTSCNGIYNITSPSPISQKEMFDLISKKVKKPIWGYINSRVIQLLFGQLADELILNGNSSLPKRLEQEGYQFKYTNFEKSLNYLL